MYKILVIDDHQIVHFGIKQLLYRNNIQATLQSVANGNQLINKIKENKYDLVILDINVPGVDSFGLIHLALSINPDLKILVFTVAAEDVYADRYYKAGVYGFLNKQADDKQIVTVLKQIMIDKKKYLSPEFINKMYTIQNHDSKGNPFESLTEKELEISLHLIRGESISDISKAMSLHTSTIGTHKARIFQKLGIENIIDLNNLANLYGISG